MEIPGLIVQSGCKFLGYKLGLHYEKLPEWLILRCTMNKNLLEITKKRIKSL